MNFKNGRNGVSSQLTRLSFGFGLGALVLSGVIGCSAVRPGEQRLVARPNMTFEDSAAFSYNSSRLFPQMATGFASSGGTQNSGCTSCR